MNKRTVSNSTLVARAALTLAIWLLAAMTLAACSTSISFLPGTQNKTATTLPAEDDASRKKIAFFAELKPVVQRQNERILKQRKQLRALQAKDQLNTTELAAVKQLAKAYGMKLDNRPTDKQWTKLLKRVDVIPLEMALIQAANESAWGKSRFAKQGNNYFGQWCYEKGCGLVPKRRAPGATHEVRRFESVEQSVAAYMKNINRSQAYAEFRQIRHSLRVQSRPLDAEVLAVGLKKYSQRGMAYVRIIRSMIRSNRQLIELS